MTVSLASVKKEGHVYSCKCGWIDQDHAAGDREDVVEIWAQFPVGGGSFIRSPGRRGWLVDYKPAIGIISTFVLPKAIPKTWFVRDRAGDVDAYRSAALALYQFGNDVMEFLQGVDPVITKSSFSYEDLSSNLIAWYKGVLGYSDAKVNDICMTVSKDESIKLAERIDIDNIHDKNRDWTKTLLFDQCSECDLRGVHLKGFVDMPPEFQLVKPGILSQTPGVGDIWPYPFTTLGFPPWDTPLPPPPGFGPTSPLERAQRNAQEAVDFVRGLFTTSRRGGPTGHR